MSADSPKSDHIAELLVHVGRASRSEGAGSGLTAAQWTCLRFFARANRSTRTPSAFASFQATTRGTASQIIKSLEGRGMVVRKKSPTDGRSSYFDLTETGRAVLNDDPLRQVIVLLDGLDAGKRDAFRATLSQLASSLSGIRGERAFGTCSDCTHFTPCGPSGYCACMATEIAVGEIDKLCIDYNGAEPLVPDSKTERNPDDSQ